MNKFLRLAATATLSGLVAFMVTAQGCSDTPPGGSGDGGVDSVKCTDPADYTTCTCDVKSDCTPLDPTKAKYYVCTPRKSCVKICFAASDCGTGELCEDSQCRKPACATDDECGSASQQCVGGACVAKLPATDVAGCAVEPATGIVHAGTTKSFNVVTKNAAGKVIPFHGDVSWTADAAVGTVAGASFTGTLTGAAANGSGKVTATVNGKSCDATITNYAAVTAGTTRIVVANFATQAPIEGATVTDGTNSSVTAADGSVSFTTPDSAYTFSVFKAGYSYVTVVEPGTEDVVVFLKPSFKAGKLTGEFSARTFDKLQDVKGTVHLAISGASIAGNVLDLSLSTLLGESVPTHIDLGGSTNVDVDLPDGISIGLAENMFKGKYSIQSSPGLRTGWSLGGNVVLSDVLGVVSSATGGGDIDIGGILSALLPVLGRLQAGAFAALEFKPDEAGKVPTDFGPTTLLRLKSKVKIPSFSTYKVGAETVNFEGAIVLAGAKYGAEGLVPLGLSAGVDKDKNGKIDAVTGTDPSAEGEVNLRFAPQNGGIEGSKTIAVSLAASFSGLIGGGDDEEEKPLVLSGRVKLPGDLLFKNNTSNVIDFGAEYLSVPDVVAIDEATRTLTISALAGADLFRLDIGSDEAEWQVFFPPGKTSVTVPMPAATFDDRFVAVSGKFPSATLQSVSLKAKNGVDYKAVHTFDADNADDLTYSLDAFSARGVIRKAVTP